LRPRLRIRCASPAHSFCWTFLGFYLCVRLSRAKLYSAVSLDNRPYAGYSFYPILSHLYFIPWVCLVLRYFVGFGWKFGPGEYLQKSTHPLVNEKSLVNQGGRFLCCEWSICWPIGVVKEGWKDLGRGNQIAEAFIYI
jgi:hypothetical protein